ncbi:MAG: hypothetical protein MJE63_08555 [Proteobacteria bacterium]|nr:hypothetical protein [Pseudomonadota bacterium]
MVLKYVHQGLNKEITAIGGHYAVTKEIKLPVEEREVLITVGYGVMDTTCCGTGGCAYATVHGYILDWKGNTSDEGFPITMFEPIKEEALKHHLQKELMQTEAIQQVNFI